MFQIGKTIVSEAIIAHDFVCNLSACKGACCVEGEAGAPLEDHEVTLLRKLYPKIRPFLSENGVHAIEAQDVVVKGSDGEWETPLVNGVECAYTFFDEHNMAKCGIEEAYDKGSITWRKPVSCHLYPVRVQHYSSFAAVNYDKWAICDSACTLGEELKVPVYKFVKDALIRKFGEAWYKELEEVAADLRK
ncbi:MAG: DUF3109 family protein [Bacteroidota bacterium]